MADNNSGLVAVVAIVAIVLIIGGIFYFVTGGTFDASKTSTTVVQPTKVVAPAGNGGGSTS